VDVPLLIDTGADVSVVPRYAAAAVGATVRPGDVALQFFDGSQSVSDVADLRVEILRYRFDGAFVIGDAPYGVLGRNILNLLTLTLDGPRHNWSA
jgi:predicted aspartyl protease